MPPQKKQQSTTAATIDAADILKAFAVEFGTAGAVAHVITVELGVEEIDADKVTLEGAVDGMVVSALLDGTRQSRTSPVRIFSSLTFSVLWIGAEIEFWMSALRYAGPIKKARLYVGEL